MFKPERFGPESSKHPESEQPLEKELHGPEGRRGVIFDFLEKEGRGPETLKTGLDTEKLNQLIKESGRGDVEYTEDGSIRDQFFTAFHPDVKYATVAAINGAPERELTPELRELKSFMPFLKNYILERAARHGAEPELPADDAVIIGFAKKEGREKTPLLGGYHASLSEQGNKVYDKTLQESVRLEGGDRQEYRTADVLRALAHDYAHSAEYKLYGRLSKAIADARGRLAATPPGNERERQKLESKVAEAIARMNASDIDVRQYGLLMVGRDHAIEIDGEASGFSLGAALFEYATDKIGRECIAAYLKERGKDLPPPRNALERLELRDLAGERIADADLEGLEDRDHATGSYMVEYGNKVLAPAHEALKRFGHLRAAAEEAVEEAALTGKFRKIKALRGRITELPPEDIDALRKYARKGAVFLRPLFAGSK